MPISVTLRSRKMRRLSSAIAAVAIATVATSGPVNASPTTSTSAVASIPLDTDTVKLTDAKIDFGGSVWDGVFSHDPVGAGTLTWTIDSGFYTPHLTGTLHLWDAPNKYARMHISYWDGGGNRIDTRHGGIVQAPNDNNHHSWSVDLSPLTLMQIVEAHVCTELSSDGIIFPQVDCKTYILN
jgi:hypothetical protein